MPRTEGFQQTVLQHIQLNGQDVEFRVVQSRTAGKLRIKVSLDGVHVVLPKSTCSQHFQVLREAGLIRCERKGVELSSRLRLREIEGRFPGLLRSILRSYGKEKGRGQSPLPRGIHRPARRAP